MGRVRSAAAGALPFVDSPDAETLLVDRAVNDAHANARVEPLRSLALRTSGGGAREAVIRVSQSDGDGRVRMAAVQYMARDIESEPQAGSAL